MSGAASSDCRSSDHIMPTDQSPLDTRNRAWQVHTRGFEPRRTAIRRRGGLLDKLNVSVPAQMVPPKRSLYRYEIAKRVSSGDRDPSIAESLASYRDTSLIRPTVVVQERNLSAASLTPRPNGDGSKQDVKQVD